MEDFSTVVASDPDEGAAYRGRAMAHRELQNYPAAIDDWSAALRLEPKSEMGYYYRGETQAAGGDHPAAIADFRRALYLDPHYIEALLARGRSLRGPGRSCGGPSGFSTGDRAGAAERRGPFPACRIAGDLPAGGVSPWPAGRAACAPAYELTEEPTQESTTLWPPRTRRPAMLSKPRSGGKKPAPPQLPWTQVRRRNRLCVGL